MLFRSSLLHPKRFNISGTNFISEFSFELEFIINTNNLSKISILTKKLSNLSNPHKSIKSLFFIPLSSKKFKPKVGGFNL